MVSLLFFVPAAVPVCARDTGSFTEIISRTVATYTRRAVVSINGTQQQQQQESNNAAAECKLSPSSELVVVVVVALPPCLCFRLPCSLLQRGRVVSRSVVGTYAPRRAATDLSSEASRQPGSHPTYLL